MASALIGEISGRGAGPPVGARGELPAVGRTLMTPTATPPTRCNNSSTRNACAAEGWQGLPNMQTGPAVTPVLFRSEGCSELPGVVVSTFAVHQ